MFVHALMGILLLYLPGCISTKPSNKFEYASCLKVAPFRERSLPQSLELKNAQCGYLFVPENRASNNKRTLTLAVIIVPSVSQPSEPDPIVYLAGGPGGSAFLELESLVKMGINYKHDLILMSQRGTLFAKPELSCPELDNFYVKSLSIPLDSHINRHEHSAASKSCYERLSKQKIDFNSYNTVESAADFADLQQALGIKKWNVLGVSYGTYLAQTLASNHPEGIRSLTLDSVVSLENGKIVASSAPNAREGFTNLFKANAARYPELASMFINLVNKLEEKPVTVSVKQTQVVLDGGALVNWLINESLNTKDFENISSSILEFENGHPEKIAKAYAQPFMIPAGLLAYGMTFAMICSGYMADQHESDVLTEGRLAFPSFPDSVLAPALHFSYVEDDCRIWGIARTPKNQRVALKSSIPTLIFSGTFDSITPPSAARALANALSNSTALEFFGVGHGVIKASSCAQKIFTSFLMNPAKYREQLVNPPKNNL